MKQLRNGLRAGLALTAVVVMSSCGNNAQNGANADSTGTAKVDTATGSKGGIKPKGAAPAWGTDIKPEMQAVIEKLESYGDKPIETLTAQEARMNHTPADAVMDLMKENNLTMPAPQCDTMGKDINGVHVRIYTPKGGTAPMPVVVYYHGGGWVIADNNTYMGSAQGICELTKAIVVSVEYRKGPEHKFPTAHNDCFAAYQWVLANAASINGDPKKVAVLGESAGGNMAVDVSIMARDKKIQLPLAQVLVYPVAQKDTTTDSYQKYAAAKPLNRPMIGWFVKNYLSSPAQTADPRINLVAANLQGLEPTTIINAEIDPLQTDGAQLADKLKAANVTVDRKVYDGVTHEFFGMAAVVPQAKDAQEYAADALKKAFK